MPLESDSLVFSFFFELRKSFNPFIILHHLMCSQQDKGTLRKSLFINPVPQIVLLP